MSIEYGYTDNITHIAEKQSIQQIAAQSAQHQQDTVNASCIIYHSMMIKADQQTQLQQRCYDYRKHMPFFDVKGSSVVLFISQIKKIRNQRIFMTDPD